MKHFITLVLCLTAMAAFVACSKSTPGSGNGQGSDGHDHADHDHDHADHDEHESGHGGAVIELGSASIAGWNVRASRDEGQIKAGGDAPIDVWLTEGTGKVNAVRFWIGSEDGAGSVKAKADIENPAEPNRWHTHAEVPNPIPAGSRLWVELDIEGQGKTAGSFDLKM